MIFLGLDLSTTATGLVRVRSGGTGATLGQGWTVEQELLIAPKSKVLEERIDAIVHALLKNLGCHLVVIEGLAGGGVFRGPSLIPLAKLHGSIEYQLRSMSIPYETVAPATWRKALLGKGNVRKDQVALEVFKRYGYEHESLDVVEAWAVAVYACRKRQGALLPEPKRRGGRASKDHGILPGI